MCVCSRESQSCGLIRLVYTMEREFDGIIVFFGFPREYIVSFVSRKTSTSKDSAYRDAYKPNASAINNKNIVQVGIFDTV